MTQAHAHLAYAPRGAGLLYGLLWLAQGDDILGWFMGTRDGEFLAAYFVLQDHRRKGEARLLRSTQNDIYGPWLQDGPAGEIDLPHPPPMSEPMCHELIRLQNQFMRHWLFVGDDPEAAAEAKALSDRELSVRAVNVRPVRLEKFRHGAAVWRYDAPGADTAVLAALSQRWPLDERVDA